LNIYIELIIYKSTHILLHICTFIVNYIPITIQTIIKSKSCCDFSTVVAPPTPVSMSTPVSTDLTKARLKRQPDIQLPGGMCDIKDLAVVSPDMMLVSNWSKQCVQLLDCLKGKVVSKVQLQGRPYRICLIDRNTAAVRVGGDIQMIKVKDKTLTKDRELTVSKDVYGLTSSRNSLVVSYHSSPWLEVISMDGKVLHQLGKSGKSQHFTNPAFMCTTPGGSMFISDRGTQTITKVDAQLNVLQTFTSPLLQEPRGITAVTEDLILVCSEKNNKIMLLQPSTNTWYTLLREDEILVCSNSNHSLVQLQQSTNTMTTLLEGPCGITAVTEDQILVCSSLNNSLVLFQPSTNTMSTLLGEDDGIKYPYSLTYCPDQKKAYVASNFTDTINVYQVS